MGVKYVQNHSTLKTNLISWWGMNEISDGTGAVIRVDSHGSNDLTDTNTTASGAGKVGTGADLERDNSECLTISSPTLPTGDMSISFWMKLETTSGAAHAILDKYKATANQRAFIFQSASGGFEMRIWDNADGVSKNQATGNFTAGTWYHVVVTFDASTGDMHTYIDGVEPTYTADLSGANSGTIATNTNAMHIGSRSGAPTTNAFDGVIDEFGMWSKVLSASEISDLYNSGDGMSYGIQHDNTTGDYTNALSRPNSRTFNHTCTGSDRFLLVGVMSSTIGAISGVKYGGVSMTQIDTYAAGPGLFDEIFLFALANPASGTNTVSIDTTGSGSVYVYSVAVSYTGVDQTTPNPHDNKNSGTSTSLTLSIDTSGSPSTDKCWIACIAGTDGNYTQSAGAGTVRRAEGLVTNWISGFDNELHISPAGSDSLVVDMSSSSQIYLIGASLALTADPGSGSYTLTADTGSFTLTALDANLAEGIKMIASPGTFTVTANDATFAQKMVAGTGSFVLTGLDVVFGVTTLLLAEAGSFVVSFKDAVLNKTGWSDKSENSSVWTDKTKY